MALLYYVLGEVNVGNYWPVITV